MNANELIQRYFLGIATAEELDELQRRLRDDVALQDEFLLQAEIETHLRQQTQSIGGVLEESEHASHPAEPIHSKQTRAPKRLLQWGSVGLAAAILLALGLLPVAGGGSALAAVRRSLDAASELTTRRYLLQVEIQKPSGDSLTIDHDLYVHGVDRMALRRDGIWPGSSIWLGRNGAEYWVVPFRGPIQKGDRLLLRRWMRSIRHASEPWDDRDSEEIPITHVTTLLKRMSREHDLELLGSEQIEIADGSTVDCQRIRAERKSRNSSKLPDVIDLWASRETGIPVRLKAHWSLESGQFGRKQVVLSFQSDEPSISKFWFTAEGHVEGDRAVIQRGSSASNALIKGPSG